MKKRSACLWPTGYLYPENRELRFIVKGGEGRVYRKFFCLQLDKNVISNVYVKFNGLFF